MVGKVTAGYTSRYQAKGTDVSQEYKEIMAQTIAEYSKKIENGEEGTPIAIGGQVYTEKEWDKLLSKFDSITEDMREQMRYRHEKEYEEYLEKKTDGKVVS